MSVVASIANPEPVDSDPQPTLRIRTAIRCTASKPSGVRPEGRTTGASLGTNSVTGGPGRVGKSSVAQAARASTTTAVAAATPARLARLIVTARAGGRCSPPRPLGTGPRRRSRTWRAPPGRRSARWTPVSYTHLRAHETRHDLVCRLLLEKKKQ